MCGQDYLPNFSDSLQQAAAPLDEQSMAWAKLQKMLLKQKVNEHFKSAASFKSPANIRTKRKLSVEGVRNLLESTSFSQIPYQATTVSLPPGTLDFGQVCSSYPGLAPLPCWQSPFHYRMRLRQATFAPATVEQILVPAKARSLSLREEGELVCNRVTPVG